MNSYDIKEFHHRLALMMNEIHRICIENGINYTLIGGSLIGAIRHKGFIPWDDDIDIALTYDNYRKFEQVVYHLNHPWLEFSKAGVTEDVFHPFIKAYDKRTTFMEEHTDKPKGIFIDIFPLIGCGNSKKEALKERRKYRFWQSLLKRKGYTFHTGGAREYILTTIAKLYSVKSLMNKLDCQYDRLSLHHFLLSADFDGTENGIVPTNLFDTYKLFPFEEFEFMGITAADEYLRLVFGDYMQLPPKSQRVPHHIVYMNLDLPYRNYVSL